MPRCGPAISTTWLSLGFHVHAIDALYHGLSDKEPWSDDPAVWPEIQVDALADVIRALDVGPVFVAGESMGALMAFELAMRFPDLCRRVVMNTGFGRVKVKRDFGPRPQGSPELRRLSQESVINPTFENLRARMDWLVVKPENMTDEMVRLREKLYSFPGVHQAMLRIYRPGQPWKWNIKWEEEDLQQFQPEALVFWTDHNPTNGPEYGEYVAGLLPNSQFYLMENAGHWPQWEHPEEHDAVLAQFLLGRRKG